jgi:ABC-type Fe3+ transport system permease subunit
LLLRVGRCSNSAWGGHVYHDNADYPTAGAAINHFGLLAIVLEAIALFGSPTLILIPARVPIITTEIWQQFQFPPNVELASAFSISLILITMALLWVQRQLLGQKGYTTITGKGGRNGY